MTDTSGTGGAGAAGTGRDSGPAALAAGRQHPQRRACRPFREREDHAGGGAAVLRGAIPRLGRVEDGTTASDFDEVELRQKRSVNLTLLPFVVDGVTVNLLDTPGYADFTGDLRAGLRAADCALFVASATDGIDGVTRLLWEECALVGMPRAVVITKIDHGRADFATVLAECQDAFGEGVAPLYLPVAGAAPGVSGLIGLLSETMYEYSSGHRSAKPVTRGSDEEAHGVGPGRADRGDHHRERRRDPDGAVPVRGDRGHRRCSSRTWRRPSRRARSTPCSPAPRRRGSGWRSCSRWSPRGSRRRLSIRCRR